MTSPFSHIRQHVARVLTALLLMLSAVSVSYGQTIISGTVYDSQTKETLIGAAVVIENTTIGITTDFEGKFRIETSESLPLNVRVSFLGYKERLIAVNEASAQQLSIALDSDAVLMKAVEVKAQRISQKQQQAALTVESMDVLAIKEAASGNFYESLGNLKEVDVTSASLGFKVINTRGFNSTSPVRSLQLIDGVDNQSPGLNFSLGNFLGASDLDLRSVEIVAGASSAFFGPGAFNGVVNMTTKDPYDFPGVSAEMKVGERAMFQNAVRVADFTTDDEGNKRWGYKVNFFRMQADDWEAEDYRPIEGAEFGEDHPFGFDAVNIYGDEDVSFNNDNSDNLFARPGLTEFSRNGYREIDLLDYATDNTKVGLGLYHRLPSEVQFDYSFNYSTGNTIYQGQNRYAMRDIQFFQHKFQVGKKDKWFVRAYRTSEDAGRTYDVVTTAIRMQEAQGTTDNWNTRYTSTWSNQILSQFPQIGLASDSIFGVVGDLISEGVISPQEGQIVFNELSMEWIDDNFDLLNEAHLTNVDIVNNQAGSELLPYFEPGTARFDSLFQDVTSRIFTDNGSRFFDRSALNHVHGEYQFDLGRVEMTMGANARWYQPDSRGTIFADTLSLSFLRDSLGEFETDEQGRRIAIDSVRREIVNSEWGAYLGGRYVFAEEKFIANATVRVDKNQNFDYLFSPALSLVYTPSEQSTWRFSLSSAIRNPTLADQYLYYDVGRALLLGNIDGAFEAGQDSLFTLDSFGNYRDGLNRDTLDWFNVDAIRPEQVQTIELGYRGRVTEDLYVDLGGYYSRYKDFIGFLQGLTARFDPNQINTPPTQLQAYQISANAESIVTTRGASLGFNYFVKKLSYSGNYSFNELVTGEDDPIIPAFNTPKHKFNLGVSGREMRWFNKINHVGFGVNYKWIQGFLFEGSPQFTGSIPTYDMVDAQINVYVPKLSSTFKVGGSNIFGIRPIFQDGEGSALRRAFNNDNFQVYGGPLVGRLLYASILIELK